MWSISGVSGHLKGQSNQSRSLRGHGVAHNVQQNATKLTKMHQNSHCTITEQRISNLSRVTYVIHFWSKWTLKRGKQSEQVMGSHIRCTKMHQNAPKCPKRSWRSKVFWIGSEWLMWSFSGVNGHLKGDRNQRKSWRSHGVAHEVHQHIAKCTKMVTMPWQSQVFWICL